MFFIMKMKEKIKNLRGNKKVRVHLSLLFLTLGRALLSINLLFIMHVLLLFTKNQKYKSFLNQLLFLNQIFIHLLYRLIYRCQIPIFTCNVIHKLYLVHFVLFLFLFFLNICNAFCFLKIL